MTPVAINGQPAAAGEILLPAHAKLISDSAIAPEVAQARGYRTVRQRAELADVGFATSQQLVPALLIPVHSVDGNVGLYQARPDNPRWGEKGKAVKYETPFGSAVILDVPPSIRAKVLDPHADLWLTEGIRKADSAASAGLGCIGIIGVWNWCRGKDDTGRRLPLPDWDRIPLVGRRAYVAFDSDVVDKHPVRQALEALFEFLAERGAQPRIVYLPPGDDGEKVGLDDYLAAGHNEQDLLELATPQLREPVEAGGGNTSHGESPRVGAAPRDRARRVAAEPAIIIRPQPVRWLWKGRLPLGSLTLLAGKQGLGKSTLTAELAARVTRGELEGDLSDPGDVLMITFEDHPATTLVPRLTAAGADLERVWRLYIEGEDDLISLPHDLAELEALARTHHAKLVIIDPVVASLPSSIDAHRDQDVRRAFAPLAGIAERCDLAVLGLIHWNKSASTDALTRISGSTAFSAAARSVLAFGTHPHEEDASAKRVLAHAKSNLAPLANSIEYQLEGHTLALDEGASMETVRIRPLGECSIAPHELFSTAGASDPTRLEEAVTFLRDELADERWHNKEEIIAASSRDRIARRTLLRAGNQIGVEFRRHGFPSKGQWRLSPVAPSLFESPVGP